MSRASWGIVFAGVGMAVIGAVAISLHYPLVSYAWLLGVFFGALIVRLATIAPDTCTSVKRPHDSHSRHLEHCTAYHRTGRCPHKEEA